MIYDIQFPDREVQSKVSRNNYPNAAIVNSGSSEDKVLMTSFQHFNAASGRRLVINTIHTQSRILKIFYC
jgi:hypothetical protein